MNYLLHLWIQFCIFAIAASSLGIVVGYCGQMALSHAAFVIFGGYVYAIVTMHLHLGFVAAAGLAAGAAAAISLIASIPAARLRGEFFILLTLAVQALLQSAMQNWVDVDQPVGSWRNLTNGPFGIAQIARPAFGGIQLDTNGGIAVIAGLCLALCLAVNAVVLRSPWGRLLQVIRDDELAARGLGKNVDATKRKAFALACAFAGLAGALTASYATYLHPSMAGLDQSILLFAMVAVGGTGGQWGPVLGAALLLALPELLAFMTISSSNAPKIQTLAYGLLLVLVVHVRPQGLAGRYRIE